ncbi:rna-directed dna polymerase from mobile element jockey-like [Limosa lapponica baueri]|uniref:Rna-directed dna polymerase from mobile element jockey-like n=1 Tax=Limosa lapponica baueri TaxID=1758121 RepID=A0A2I0TTD4_LIMLA|nr:rna-directed dna polymerase from mobile element jockey-like [Limosa lapponica baueri]
MLFNVFISNPGSSTECTLNKFVDDTKPSGAVDSLEGRDDIQWDLHKLEEWAHENLMKFNKTKCKVLHLDLCNLHYQYIYIGDEWIQNSPVEKDLGIQSQDKGKQF